MSSATFLPHVAFELHAIVPNLPYKIADMAVLDDRVFLATSEGLLVYSVEVVGSSNGNGNGASVASSCGLLRHAIASSSSTSSTSGPYKTTLVFSDKKFSKKPVTKVAILEREQLLLSLSDSIYVHDVRSKAPCAPVTSIARAKGASLFAVDSSKTVPLVVVALKKKLLGALDALVDRVCRAEGARAARRAAPAALLRRQRLRRLQEGVLHDSHRQRSAITEVSQTGRANLPCRHAARPSSRCSSCATTSAFSPTTTVAPPAAPPCPFAEPPACRLLPLSVRHCRAAARRRGARHRRRAGPRAAAAGARRAVARHRHAVAAGADQCASLARSWRRRRRARLGGGVAAVGGGDRRAATAELGDTAPLYAASTGALWRLRPVPLGEQCDRLVRERRFDEALALCETMPVDTRDRADRLRRIKRLFALHLFASGQFDKSLVLLHELHTFPLDVLVLYDGLLPEAAARSVRWRGWRRARAAPRRPASAEQHAARRRVQGADCLHQRACAATR
jgi:hypothetical protein